MFWFPTSFLRKKWIWKLVLKQNEETQIEDLINFFPIVYKSIRNYIKMNGHFELIYIENEQKSKISIRV